MVSLRNNKVETGQRSFVDYFSCLSSFWNSYVWSELRLFSSPDFKYHLLRRAEVVETCEWIDDYELIAFHQFLSASFELMCPINDCVTTMVPKEVTLEMALGNATFHIFLDSWEILNFRSTSSCCGGGEGSRFSCMLFSMAVNGENEDGELIG